jgi:SSS family transporter
MRTIDWAILLTTLILTILYGVYKSRSTRNLDGYFRGNREMPWYLVLLGIMGTQASAVTFLSAPGQAYTDGMRFVQYYFGLPIAMVVLSITFVPIFRKLNLFTAYEFLEKRFDAKTRTLTSALFLLSRGLSTGISVYAPSIILSSLLGWNIYWTNALMGGLLIIYTVSGGAKAVAHTQKLQLTIVFIGLFLAGFLCVRMLPEGVGFWDALQIGGKIGKMNIITTGISENGFDWNDRFNIFSGIIGGFFLALSYFGTDQSQVGRFLTARSESESKLGLLLNGMVKIPMQFFILLIGILLFTFYQFHPSPLLFNQQPVNQAMATSYGDSIRLLQQKHDLLAPEKHRWALATTQALNRGEKAEAEVSMLQQVNIEQENLRNEAKRLIKASGNTEVNDTNYIFLRFVVDQLPAGMVGLLIAIIFLAAWGSIAAALNSLASASVVDFHKKFIQTELSEEQDYRISRWYSLFWGIFCVVTAMFVTGMGSLIEAVNVLGSWFYGVILGIFLVAFYVPSLKGSAVFWSALLAQLLVILTYLFIPLGWLWLNVLGVGLVVGFSLFIGLIQRIFLK